MKKKYKLICISLIILFIMCIFTGCWDQREIEEQGYVAAIGMDKGRGDKLRITFQITNPKVGTSSGRGGGGSQGEVKSDIVTIETTGILTARDLVNISVTRKISLSHSKIIVVGEELARGEGFFRMIEGTLREKELRRAMIIMVSRESAEEFIRNNNPTLEDRPQKFYEFMSRRWTETGLVPPFSNVNRFMERTEAQSGIFLTIYGSTKEPTKKEGKDEGDFYAGQVPKFGGNPTELIGAAVFRAGRMVGRMSGDEVRLTTLLRAKPEVKTMLISFPDPIKKNHRIAARILKQKKTKVNIDVSGNNPKIVVNVPVSIDVLGISSFEKYPEDLNKQSILKDSIKKYLEKESLALIEKTKQEFVGEPFQWQLEVRKRFKTYDALQSYNWPKKYLSSEVTVNYDVILRSFGKQLNPPTDPLSSDKEQKEQESTSTGKE